MLLSDSYPVTWLTKVVALLPLVADSLALYGLCGLALPSIIIGRLANGWPSKWGTTNEHKIWSRYFCPLKVPSILHIYSNRKKTRCKKYFPFQIWWSLTYGQVYIYTRQWTKNGTEAATVDYHWKVWRIEAEGNSWSWSGFNGPTVFLKYISVVLSLQERGFSHTRDLLLTISIHWVNI